MVELIRLLTDANNGFAVPRPIYDVVTGLVIILGLLSIKYFQHVDLDRVCGRNATKARNLFYTGAITLLLAILANRFLNYPPQIAASQFLYVLSYLFIFSAALTIGVQSKVKEVEEKNGNKTINPA